ncbi:RdgB/HAM1 family non-canonical purine NTP pyrophosphatase [Actinomarinicola tropica]|uniref:dITP/XTP pyrophosphatase n=1 Tax=Actinomarinicola tropica TaxID=2789776 RepID=A0A5Q2RMH8_9ACTN|nr:RdgB/HAM1 family non-canonical purine NTP pyrophosphatase [Actinomarinicola tropica]QGG95761.1 RdgB/HAM1 family non-canonical purine NTP pyrophosphatase [Actinomarinicola tropica]
MTDRVVLATANPGKAAEIAAVLAGTVEVEPRPDHVPDVVEDADTLEGNARLKAVAICDATGQPALADDTGLEVDALDGAPGVRSARFAGPEEDPVANRRQLLAELDRLGATEGDQRRARFRTVLVLRRPDGTEVIADGAVEGTIASELRGGAGFGYDPLFVPDDGDGRTFAEMSADEKNAISHRGRALRALADRLSETEAS